MYCYYQDQHERPGGARYAAPVAVGVCQQCGAAVCAEHAHKDSYPGAPLLCHECASVVIDSSTDKMKGQNQPVS